jgi:hypothetical protein
VLGEKKIPQLTLILGCLEALNPFPRLDHDPPLPKHQKCWGVPENHLIEKTSFQDFVGYNLLTINYDEWSKSQIIFKPVSPNMAH